MPKTRTTVSLEGEVLRAVKVRAARSGRGESQIIEDAVRSYLKLDLFDDLWSRSTLSEEEATRLAVEAQHATRPDKH